MDPVTPQKWGFIVPRSPAPGLPMAAGAIDLPGILMSMDGKCWKDEETMVSTPKCRASIHLPFRKELIQPATVIEVSVYQKQTPTRN